jgi:hypothetical protein
MDDLELSSSIGAVGSVAFWRWVVMHFEPGALVS